MPLLCGTQPLIFAKVKIITKKEAVESTKVLNRSHEEVLRVRSIVLLALYNVSNSELNID